MHEARNHEMPLDTIEIRGISATGYHGVFDFERRDGQTFIADVTLHCDTSAAAASDDLTDTINYGTLGSEIHAAIASDPVDLIETLAQRIATLCLGKPGAQAVDVTINKPQAPLEVPFGNVSVSIRRFAPVVVPAAVPAVVPAAVSAVVPAAVSAAPAPPSVSAPASASIPASASDTHYHVVLSLGSNLGAPEHYLQSAITHLALRPEFTITGVSPLYTSEPWGAHLMPHVADEPLYANCVVTLATHEDPAAVLAITQVIEHAHARVRAERWGARTLDIDLVQVTLGQGEETRAVASNTATLTLPHPYAAERLFVLQPWVDIEPEARLGETLVADLVVALRDAPRAEGEPDYKIFARPQELIVPTLDGQEKP